MFVMMEMYSLHLNLLMHFLLLLINQLLKTKSLILVHPFMWLLIGSGWYHMMLLGKDTCILAMIMHVILLEQEMFTLLFLTVPLLSWKMCIMCQAHKDLDFHRTIGWSWLKEANVKSLFRSCYKVSRQEYNLCKAPINVGSEGAASIILSFLLETLSMVHYVLLPHEKFLCKLWWAL